MSKQNGVLNFERFENLRQDLERLVVHKTRRAGKRDWVGIAVARATVDQSAESGDRSESFRKVAPHCDTPKTFVQEDDGWSVVRRRAYPFVFEFVRVGLYKAHVWLIDLTVLLSHQDMQLQLPAP